MAQKKSLRVLLLILILAALTGLILFFAVKGTKKTSTKNASETSLKVIQETVTNVIEISGTIQAAQTQSLTAAGNGTVTAVYVKVGDKVKKGQVLMELDKSEQEYNLAKHDYDTAQKQINGSPKELELMAYQRKTLEKKLEDRKIKANFDGVVADFTAGVGDYLEAKDSVGTLIQRDYLKSYVEVVETDAPKLQAGQKVSCTFPAYGDKKIQGEVVSYPAVGSVTSRGASIVKVEIRIYNPPEIILPNYSFTGEIEISPPENLTLIQREAIGFSADKKSFVELYQRDGSTQKMEIVAIPYDRTYFKVVQGDLSENAELKPQSASQVSGTRPGNFKAGSSSQNKEEGSGFGGLAVPGMGGMPPAGGPSGAPAGGFGGR